MYINIDVLSSHALKIDEELKITKPLWEPLYNSYIDGLADSKAKVKLPFPTEGELSIYLNLGTALKNIQTEKKEKFFLRYLGQNIADLEYDKKNKKFLLSTHKYSNTNARDFDFKNKDGSDIKYKHIDWNSEEADYFKKFFQDFRPRSKKSGKGNEEHRYQNLLFREFSKVKGFDKHIKNIQPVKILGAFFEMPVPLKGFDHKDKEILKGGHIDILAAIRHGNKTRAAVIEVKDDRYNKREDINAVLTQAITYACCVRRLLRGEKGKEWAEFFGYSRPISLSEKSITIDVIACIPEIPEQIRKELKQNVKISIGQDFLALRFISYMVTGNNILEIQDFSIWDKKK